MKSYLTKMTYGNHAIHGIAKLYASPRGNEGKVHKTLIAGVILTPESLTPNKDEDGHDIERMYECEVIIIPKRIFENDLQNGRGGRIDSILECGYGYSDNYEREIPIQNK